MKGIVLRICRGEKSAWINWVDEQFALDPQRVEEIFTHLPDEMLRKVGDEEDFRIVLPL